MIKSEIAALVKELTEAPSCAEELKSSAEAYLAAVDTDGEQAAEDAFKKALDENVCTIDESIGLFESDLGAQIFGEEQAKGMAASFKEAKAAGEKYCLCPACQAGYKVYDMLTMKGLIGELTSSKSCKDAPREAAENYAEAVGTENEQKAADEFKAVLNEWVNTIDESLDLFKSEAGRQKYGEEEAARRIERFSAAKAAGEKYCLCTACQPGYKIYDLLMKKG
jgi:hypothetical protein